MAKQEHKRSIEVYAHWQGMDEPVLMGVLYSKRLKGKELFSFEYHKEFLTSEPSSTPIPSRRHPYQ